MAPDPVEVSTPVIESMEAIAEPGAPSSPVAGSMNAIDPCALHLPPAVGLPNVTVPAPHKKSDEAVTAGNAVFTVTVTVAVPHAPVL